MVSPEGGRIGVVAVVLVGSVAVALAADSSRTSRRDGDGADSRAGALRSIAGPRVVATFRDAGGGAQAAGHLHASSARGFEPQAGPERRRSSTPPKMLTGGQAQALAKMERRALTMLLDGDDERLAALRAQLQAATVASRERSETGFFTRLSVPAALPRVRGIDRLVVGDLYADVSGLERPAGFLLFVTAGALDMLESFSFDDRWPEDAQLQRAYYVHPSAPGSPSLVETRERDLAWALAGAPRATRFDVPAAPGDFQTLYRRLRESPFPKLGKGVGAFPAYEARVAACARRASEGEPVQRSEVPFPDDESARTAELLRRQEVSTADEAAFIAYFDLLERIRAALLRERAL